MPVLVYTALVSDTRYLLYSIYYYIYDDALVVNIRKRHICDQVNEHDSY